IEGDGNDDGRMRCFCERPFDSIGYPDDGDASLPRFGSQLHNFLALAAARNDNHRGAFRKRGESQQFVSVLQVNRISMLMKERAHVERRMPTTPDPRQVDVPRPANGGGRRLQRGPATTVLRKKADGPPQFLGLPQYVFQKMCHRKVMSSGLTRASNFRLQRRRMP